jgi:hypothetical protein
MATSAIKVVVRVRPPSSAEVEDADRRGQGFAQGTLDVLGDAEVTASLPALNVLSPSYGKGSETSFRCKFTRVLRPEASQEDVFDIFESDMASVLTGANVTIFAYGQTGTGKTHTMVGQRQDPHGSGSGSRRRLTSAAAARASFARLDNSRNWGMIPRSLQYLFGHASVTSSAAPSPSLSSAAASSSSPGGSSSPSSNTGSPPLVFLMSCVFAAAPARHRCVRVARAIFVRVRCCFMGKSPSRPPLRPPRRYLRACKRIVSIRRSHPRPRPRWRLSCLPRACLH